MLGSRIAACHFPDKSSNVARLEQRLVELSTLKITQL